jgi:hypothetical protein
MARKQILKASLALPGEANLRSLKESRGVWGGSG